MSREAMKLALEALMRSRKAVSGDLDLAGCAYGKNDPDGHRYDDAKQALVTLDKAITALREALAEQPAQRKYCRGDRLICLETEEYCVIHISGTDRQWVKFPDTHIGVYKNEQLAELFELLPKEIEIEQPAQQEPWPEDPAGHKAGGVQLSGTSKSKAITELYALFGAPHNADINLTGLNMLLDALIASPPAQRTWVGLTDEEILIISRDHYDPHQRAEVSFARAIEAKLKEKNT